MTTASGLSVAANRGLSTVVMKADGVDRISGKFVLFLTRRQQESV